MLSISDPYSFDYKSSNKQLNSKLYESNEKELYHTHHYSVFKLSAMIAYKEYKEKKKTIINQSFSQNYLLTSKLITIPLTLSWYNSVLRHILISILIIYFNIFSYIFKYFSVELFVEKS